MMVPHDVPGNLRFRADVISAEGDTRKYVKEMARRDVVFFFNTFLWAEDPFAEKGLRHGIPLERIRPIILYPFQEEFVLGLQDAINVGADEIADKSRDMLATYMVLGVYLHGWLFRGHKYMITSWKQEEIDGKEDTSTHFGKLRFMLDMLPEWMKPAGWDLRKHSSYMRMQNPENKGTLTGSAASAGLASGRREDSIFLDELSKWEERAREAWISASDSTKCKISVWTPRGSGNLAAELMRGDEIKRKRHLFWHLHPEKCYVTDGHLETVKAGKVRDKVRKYVVTLNTDQKGAKAGTYVDQYGRLRSEWYDKECEGRTPEDIAENLDCDYLTTGRPVFDTLKCQEKLYASRPPKWTGDLIWKIRPIFDATSGQCVNQDQLAVEFIENSNGLVSLWEKPESGWMNGYVIGADTAEGLEQHDWDSAEVLRRFGDKPGQAAALHGHVKMHEYAEELAKLGVYFKNALVNVERNNHGHGVIAHLVKLYKWLFHKAIFTKGYAEITDRIGFETGGQSKPVIIGTLGKAIALDEFECLDEGFWRETLTFVNDDGKMEAQGKHRGEKCFDDRVMRKAITWWSHLNMPLPAIVRIVEKPEGWRKARMKQNKQQSAVGWVV
jgi:hypothetical protein